MVSTDPIADMLTRVRNAIAVQKNEVSMPYSKIKQTVAEVLAKNNFVDSVEVFELGGFKRLKIVINKPETNANITEIKRMSTPGRRMYTGSSDIPNIKNGRGIVVISTSRGIMAGAEAKQAGLGGELICKVY
jgi:small subunit ribosomal protein S8